MWETLSNIEGDGQFVNENFESSSGGGGGSSEGGGGGVAAGGQSSEEQDRLLAESLQQEAVLETQGLSE